MFKIEPWVKAGQAKIYRQITCWELFETIMWFVAIGSQIRLRMCHLERPLKPGVI